MADIKTIYNEEFKNLGHLMLDLETMGTRVGCAIVSIGAVEFDINTGKFGRHFYERVDLQSCLDVGLFVEARTVYWWMQQSEAARKEIYNPENRLELHTVLAKLESFMQDLGTFYIWGNGASFDFNILGAAIYACGFKQVPWNFRLERDVRTVVMIAPHVKDNYPFCGIVHNALDDCIHQIKYVSEIWQNYIKKEL
jgi:DNA polymerase III epsilon subunit-like protein